MKMADASRNGDKKYAQRALVPMLFLVPPPNGLYIFGYMTFSHQPDSPHSYIKGEAMAISERL